MFELTLRHQDLWGDVARYKKLVGNGRRKVPVAQTTLPDANDHLLDKLAEQEAVLESIWEELMELKGLVCQLRDSAD